MPIFLGIIVMLRVIRFADRYWWTQTDLIRNQSEMHWYKISWNPDTIRKEDVDTGVE